MNNIESKIDTLIDDVKSLKSLGNRHRYDEIIALVASISFGITISKFKIYVNELENLGIHESLQYFTVTLCIAVYFRNIHGLISYDIWSEKMAYISPFLKTSRQIAFHFLFALVAVLFLPYLFLNVIISDGSLSLLCFSIFIFLPLAIYMPWNWFWYKKLKSKNSAADSELKKFTVRWLFQDAALFLILIIGMLCWVFTKESYSFDFVSVLFCVSSAIVLIYDYTTHMKYYFAVPVS